MSLQRETEAVELRIGGCTFDQIGTKLGVGRPQAYKLVKRAMGRLIAESVEQVADLLDVSVSTVEDDWRIARAWLAVQLEGEAAP